MKWCKNALRVSTSAGVNDKNNNKNFVVFLFSSILITINNLL